MTPETLIDLPRLRQALQEGTGRGVSVAILDTGVDATHPDLGDCIKACYEVQPGRRGQCVPTESGDAIGHGTACAGIIHELAPEAELHSVRIIPRGATGSIDQLIGGLEWAIENDMDVINISAGTCQRDAVQRLQPLVDRAYFRGQLVVAAAHNRGEVSYPGHFASVLAVDFTSFPEPTDFHFLLKQPIEISARGIYVKAPSPKGGHRLYTGTSFACPHVSALAARLRSQMPGLTPFQLKSLLWFLRGNRDEASSSSESVAD